MQVKNSKLFKIEVFATKPHWTTDYFDVLSGCKDTFKDYQDKVLKQPIATYEATFEFQDFEKATFQFTFLASKILAYDIAYIKITDINNVLQGGNFKELYYFATSIDFISASIVKIDGVLDYWMTFWPIFEFNGKSLLVQRRHFPRYRTDKDHIGEYDFSTNSPVVNVDNIETSFTNIITTKTLNLRTNVDPDFPLEYISQVGDYAYCFVLPDESDSVGWLKDGKLTWTTIKDMRYVRDKDEYFTLLELLHIDSPKNARPQGCPWIIFSIAQATFNKTVTITSVFDNKTIDRDTFIQYDYKAMSYLGNQRIASLQIFDHPIMSLHRKGTPFNLYSNRLFYIEGVSDYTLDIYPNVKEIVGLYSDGDGFKLNGWQYNLGLEKLEYYKPLKEYTENDLLSLDQEPALFRTPHFELEYVVYSCKGFYKVQNELLLSEGWNNDYGNLYCDYVLHLNTHLKYIYANIGWYKYQYRMWRFGLFEENIYSFDLITDAYKNYMQQNMNRFNTSVTQNWWNMGLSIGGEVIGAGLGIALAPFTGGSSLAITGAALGAGLLSIGNSVKNGYFANQQYQAQLKDLQRTPSTVMNQSNSFSNNAVKQMTPEGITGNIKGTVSIRQHRENEQWILYWHFHQYGYLVNKRMTVKDKNWFYSRTWFDFFMLEDFSNVVNQTEYSQIIMNKFNNIFKRGIRFWHTIDNFLNYEKNNKEIASWKEVYLKR